MKYIPETSIKPFAATIKYDMGFWPKKKTNIQKAKTQKPKSQACINSKLLKEHPQCARHQDAAGASILRGNKLADNN